MDTLSHEEKQLNELQLDIDEIQNLHDTSATRKNVKVLLAAWVEKLNYEKANIQKILDQQKPQKIEVQEKPLEDPVAKALRQIETTRYETISKFGWDQQGTKLKVYLTGLEGIGKIPVDNIVCEFETRSFDLRIQGLNGKNYRLRIPELQNDIDLAQCKHNVKSSSITITLKLEKDERWTDLKPKATLMQKPAAAKKEKEDPTAGLMNMMKEMYTNGDDKMKQMITESWQKSQDEKDGKKAKTSPGDINDRVNELNGTN